MLVRLLILSITFFSKVCPYLFFKKSARTPTVAQTHQRT